MITKSETIMQLLSLHEKVCEAQGLHITDCTDISDLARTMQGRMAEQLTWAVDKYRAEELGAAEFVQIVKRADEM